MRSSLAYNIAATVVILVVAAFLVANVHWVFALIALLALVFWF